MGASLTCCYHDSTGKIVETRSQGGGGSTAEETITTQDTNTLAVGLKRGLHRRKSRIELAHLPLCPKFGCSFAFLHQFADEKGSRASRLLIRTQDQAQKRNTSSQVTVQENFTMGTVCMDIIKPSTRILMPLTSKESTTPEEAMEVAAKTLIRKSTANALEQTSAANDSPVDATDLESKFYDESYSYAELAIQAGMKDQRGQPAFSNATHFVSHAWRYDFHSFVKALRSWMDETEADEDTTYFWVDAFVVNQHKSQDFPQEWWSTRFMEAIGQIGNTVLILEPWHHPVPFTRAWVIWELYCTSVTGARLHLTMRAESLEEFNSALCTSFETVQTALSSIDVERCQAFHQKDQEMIHNEIKRTVGFTKMNELIQTRLNEWLVETAKRRLQGMLAAEGAQTQQKDKATVSDDERMKRLKLHGNLARMLREGGNLAEAEENFRELLLESERVLGKDDLFSLTCLNQLAVTLQKEDKIDESMRMHRDCLQRRLGLFGAAHADTLQSTSNLAVLLSSEKPLSKRNFVEAQQLFRQAISGREALNGPQNPGTLYTVSSLAKLLSEAPEPTQQLFDEAEALHQRAVDELSKALHEAHPLTLTAMHNQACHWLARFNFEQSAENPQLVSLAIQQLRSVHTSRTEKLGKTHPDTLLSEEALKLGSVRHRDVLSPQSGIKNYASFAELSLQEFHECRTREHFKEMRDKLQIYGVGRLRDELVNSGFVDPESELLTVGMQPFNVFARIACGAIEQPTMADQQANLGDFQDQFIVVCNKKEADDMWDSVDPTWMGRASMSKRHRMLILKNLHWEWFNALTFGFVSGVSAGVKKLQDIKTAAESWVRAQDDWPPVERVGFFLHIYAHCSVNSFHLHVLDMDCTGPTFEKLKYKNLAIDDAIQVLKEEDLGTEEKVVEFESRPARESCCVPCVGHDVQP